MALNPRPAATALASLLVLCAASVSLRAEEQGGASDKAAAAAVDFARDVQPVLRRHCFRCHGPAKQEGSLALDRRDVALGYGFLSQHDTTRHFGLGDATTVERIEQRVQEQAVLKDVAGDRGEALLARLGIHRRDQFARVDGHVEIFLDSQAGSNRRRSR